MNSPGHAERRVGAERQRIEEVVVDAPIDHVHAAQAIGRAHVDDVVVDEEVAAFDQLDAHLPREKRVLEVGGVEDAGREHHDRRFGVLRRRERAQRREQRLTVVIDRLDLVVLEQLREDALDDLAVRQHVRHAARHAQIVLEHREAAVGQPHEIGAGDRHVEMPPQEDAAHLAPVVLRAVDQLARHDAFREDAAVVVDVAQEQVERGQALRQAALDRLPLRRGQDARQQVVGKDALGAGLIAVDRERDALLQERASASRCRLRRSSAGRSIRRSKSARYCGRGCPPASNISSKQPSSLYCWNKPAVVSGGAP